MVVKSSELTCKYLMKHQLLITFKTTCNRLVALNPALYMMSDQLFTELSKCILPKVVSDLAQSRMAF